MNVCFTSEGCGKNPALPRDGVRTSVISLLKKPSSWAWWVYLVIMTAEVPIYYLSTDSVSRLVYDTYGLSSAMVIFLGLRMNRIARRGPWLAFGVGTGLFALGDVVYNFYAMVGLTVPTVSAADIFYLAAYPAFVIGMFLLVHIRSPKSQLVSTLDGLIVAFAVGALAWTFVLGQYARNDTMSVDARFIAIIYPTLDLLLVVFIIRLVFSAGARNISYRLLLSSVVVMFVADALSSFATVHNWFSFSYSTPIDIGWLASYALWGASALHPSMGHLAEPSASSEPRHPRAALLMLGAAAMTAPVAVIVRELQGERADIGVLTVFSAVIFALIVARLWLVSRNLQSAHHLLAVTVTRQTVFATAANAFVGASDFESVARAGVDAALALAYDEKPWASFVVDGPTGPTVVAEAGCPPVHSDDQLERTSDVDRKCHDGTAAIAGSREAAASSNLPPHCVIAEHVTVDNQIRGTLKVNIAGGDRRDLASSLRQISIEMGLALKGVESAQERLGRRNERRFRSLVQKSTDLVTLVDGDGHILYQSPSAERTLGRNAEDMVGREFGFVVHLDDTPGFEDAFLKVRYGQHRDTVQIECRMSHDDGTWRVMDCCMTNLLDDPDVGAILLNSRDVTERRSLEQQLHHQAFHDSLTGLANRALFHDRLEQALLRARRETASVAMMFLDIDDFKTINDSLGHEAGDKLLAAVGERLAHEVRPKDALARIGGDEFAILVDHGIASESAKTIARRILRSFRDPVQVDNESVTVQVSIGIAVSDSLAECPDVLIRNADLAMYSAKRNGKDRFEVFEQNMYERAAYRFDLATELRRAITNEELEVYYQPIVGAHNSRVHGVEALVRWNREGFGMVPAIEFIEVAESTQLIIPLGEWVLDQACAQVQRWRNEGTVEESFYLSVNLSPRQLEEPTIVESVVRALRTTGLPASSLVLEVTESSVLLDADVGLSRINSLKSLGVRLAIDDYGTGYSSLSRLADLPLDFVKIDKSFIDRLTLDAAGRALVQSIIDVTSALGMSCVAEGVEFDVQRTTLVEMGCDSIQGYLFAKPMPSFEADLMFHVLSISESSSTH